MTLLGNLVKLGAGALMLSAPEKAWKLLSAGAIERVSIQGDQAGLAGRVGRYLETVATVLARPHGPLTDSREFDLRLGRWVDTPVELIYQAPTLYLYRGRPLLATWKTEKQTDGGLVSGYELSFLRGTVDLPGLVRAAKAQGDICRGRAIRFSVRERSGSGFMQHLAIGDAPSPPRGGGSPPPLAWSCAPVRYLAGQPSDFGRPTGAPVSQWMWWSEHAQLLRDDAKRWIRRRRWCAERGIPWRRGWMLHGKPGNGKTLVAYAIAEELDLPLFAVDLSSMTSEDFVKVWREATMDAPAMVLVEDFDSTIVLRENIRSKAHGVAFETILNCVAGVSRQQGVLFIMTTNDAGAVDPALCSPTADDMESRPGRIDLSVAIGNPSYEGRLCIAKRVLQDEQRAREVATQTEGRSITQVQELCYRIAEVDYETNPSAP